MDKVKFDFSQTSLYESISFKGNIVQVNPYISTEDKVFLINQYVSNYFFPKEEMLSINTTKRDYLGAEWALIYAIVDLQTNVDFEVKSFDQFLQSGVWNKIKEKLVNYDELRNEIDIIVNDIKDEMRLEKSIGTVIDQMSSKFFDFMETASSNLNVEEVRKVGIELIQSMEKSPVAGAFEEAKVENRKKKKA